MVPGPEGREAARAKPVRRGEGKGGEANEFRSARGGRTSKMTQPAGARTSMMGIVSIAGLGLSRPAASSFALTRSADARTSLMALIVLITVTTVVRGPTGRMLWMEIASIAGLASVSSTSLAE